MIPAEKKARKEQYWARGVGFALVVLSVFASIHWGWMSLPQVPTDVKALGKLPPTSLRDLAQLIVSIVVPLVFFARNVVVGLPSSAKGDA